MSRIQAIQSEVQRWLPILQAEATVKEVIVFGSVALDQVKEWSDVDLCIIQDTELRFYDRIAWWLRKLRPEVGVDLIVYTPDEVMELKSRSGFYTNEIEQKGKILYAA